MWKPKWLQRNDKPSLPTVRPHPDRPVPVNPPWRKDYANESEWLAAVKDYNSKLAEFEKNRCLQIGITRFRWMWSGGGPFPCSVGTRLNGEVFDYREPPPEGLPRSCICDHDYCRYCTAISIVPGFD